jgi:hypothetical protein
MSKIKCNGYSSNAYEYSHTAKQQAFELFNELRPILRQELKKRFSVDLHAGRRFENNDSVSLRLFSAATEQDFLENPRQWAWAALEECAEADHWYTYEKDWG